MYLKTKNYSNNNSLASLISPQPPPSLFKGGLQDKCEQNMEQTV